MTDNELAEAAMCMWEYVIENRDKPHIQAAIEAEGAGALRNNILARAEDCHKAWLLVADNYPFCFDWDFVPEWMEANMNWNEL
jgi:hypothetical protein